MNDPRVLPTHPHSILLSSNTCLHYLDDFGFLKHFSTSFNHKNNACCHERQLGEKCSLCLGFHGVFDYEDHSVIKVVMLLLRNWFEICSRLCYGIQQCDMIVSSH